MYEFIVFAQGDYANTPMHILDQFGSEKLLEYLQQWHFPNEHDTQEELGNGTTDTIEEFGNYVLVYNIKHNYCGLYYKLEVLCKK